MPSPRGRPRSSSGAASPTASPASLLSYLTLTTTSGKSRDGFYAGTGLVKWIETTSGGGDWRLTAGTDDDVRTVLDTGRPKPAAPDTDRFAAEGWIQLNVEQP